MGFIISWILYDHTIGQFILQCLCVIWCHLKSKLFIIFNSKTRLMNEIVCVSFSLLCFKAFIAFLFVRLVFFSPIPAETRVYWYIHVKSIDQRRVSSHSTVQPAVFNLFCAVNLSGNFQLVKKSIILFHIYFFIFPCSFTYLPVLGSFY